MSSKRTSARPVSPAIRYAIPRYNVAEFRQKLPAAIVPERVPRRSASALRRRGTSAPASAPATLDPGAPAGKPTPAAARSAASAQRSASPGFPVKAEIIAAKTAAVG